METYYSPSKEDRNLAKLSCGPLENELKSCNSNSLDIQINGSHNKLKIPFQALSFLAQILKITSRGLSFSLVTTPSEIGVFEACNILGCSEAFLNELLAEGKIPFTKVGKHIRIKFDDLISYHHEMKKIQKQSLIDLINSKGN
ncbi:excisionase family DNA-binding protein [Gaetbulibacter sp. M240]|uniref:excisionase family DNA-binding protein n=1 Tax=Gaetbulibacter sp. M240 TaxID=3126511 RepID=UPI00374F295F